MRDSAYTVLMSMVGNNWMPDKHFVFSGMTNIIWLAGNHLFPVLLTGMCGMYYVQFRVFT